MASQHAPLQPTPEVIATILQAIACNKGEGHLVIYLRDDGITGMAMETKKVYDLYQIRVLQYTH